MIFIKNKDLKTVNKREIVDEIYRLAEGKLLKKDLKIMVDLYGKAIVNLLNNGNIIRCRNMGTFSLKKYENRKGRDRETGEIFTIPTFYRPVLEFPDAIYAHFKQKDRKKGD